MPALLGGTGLCRQLLLFAAVGALLSANPRSRTRRGDVLAAQLRQQGEGRAAALSRAFAGASESDVATVVALKGPSGLAGTPLEDLDKVFKKGSSGGCGCGCGGCGCGGCGGCGA